MPVKLYALSIVAMRRDPDGVVFAHCPGYTTANSENEAYLNALMLLAPKKFPCAEGWIEHRVNLIELPEEITMPDLAAW